MDELATLDATAQASLVRAGTATPAELVDAAIRRIESVDPSLNSVVYERFDAARAEAAGGAVEGPFRGVPFLTKDLKCHTAGEPTSEGMRALKEAGYRAPVTYTLAQRWKDAGLVNLGRTSSPELGLTPTTEPVAWGPTRNPWNPERTPGGSSGGAAAAVAAGLVPAAHASDGGGSIRIPASCCGLVGLKPSRGRVPIGPVLGELTTFLSVQFAVTRSVRDAAALLDAVAGPAVGDAYTAPPPTRPFAAEVGADPGRLRIGLTTRHPGSGEPVHPECVAATERAGKLLESLGHAVELGSPPPFEEREEIARFAAIWSVLAASGVAAFGAAIGRELGPDDVEPVTWALAEHGRGVSALEYGAALDGLQQWSRRVRAWWEGDGGFDLLLTPTLAEPPPPLGTFDPEPNGGATGAFSRGAAFTPYTPVANATGQPAISLPVHQSSDGLPVGVQLMAAYGREDVLLRVASQVEGAAPWHARRPTIHA